MLDQTMTHDNDNEITGGLQIHGAGPGRRTPTHSPAPAHHHPRRNVERLVKVHEEKCLRAFFEDAEGQDLDWLYGAVVAICGFPKTLNPHQDPDSSALRLTWGLGFDRAELLGLEIDLHTDLKFMDVRDRLDEMVREKWDAQQ